MEVPNARRIARAISDGIVAGEPPPGDMLPSERTLATTYGVSRPLIREALRSVEEMGLIETRPGRGTFVRSEAAPGVHRGVGVAILRRGATASQLSEARITLECEAASLAATRATPADLARRLPWSGSSGANRSSMSRTTWSSTWGSRPPPTTRSSR